MDPKCIEINDWIGWISRLDNLDVDHEEIKNQIYNWNLSMMHDPEYLIDYNEFKIFVSNVHKFIEKYRYTKNKNLQCLLNFISDWWYMYNFNIKRNK